MATRNNRMSGSNKANHKTTLPSQVGRQGLRARDMNRGQGQQQQQYPQQRATMPQQQMVFGAPIQQPAQPMMPMQPMYQQQMPMQGQMQVPWQGGFQQQQS